MLGAALLSEDLSDRLSVEQTTEAIEATKVDDSIPVFAMLAGVADRFTPKRKDNDEQMKTSERQTIKKGNRVRSWGLRF